MGGREGDLILHDNDVDLAILNPDWDDLLEGLRRHLPPKYSLKGTAMPRHPGQLSDLVPLGAASC